MDQPDDAITNDQSSHRKRVIYDASLQLLHECGPLTPTNHSAVLQAISDRVRDSRQSITDMVIFQGGTRELVSPVVSAAISIVQVHIQLTDHVNKFIAIIPSDPDVRAIFEEHAGGYRDRLAIHFGYDPDLFQQSIAEVLNGGSSTNPQAN